MFTAIAAYVTQHPEADDANQANVRLLENSVKLHLEAEAVPITDVLLKRPDVDEGIRTMARQVRGLGLVQSGRIPEALEIFTSQLGASRFRASNATIDFGLMLATQMQVKGDVAAAREVYERLGEAFPLIQELRQLTDRRLARLELIGKPAPPIRVKDLEGKDLDISEFAGKVVLLDFWATFCKPCLVEIPTLKRIYAEHHSRGFEIVSISLDESETTVNEFQKQLKLPWRLAMDDADNTLSKPYSVPTIPGLFLIDQKGKVVFADLKGDDLDRAIARLLDEAK